MQVGQPAVLRFSAFNPRTTPEINGAVIRVSADVATDPSFDTVRIAMPEHEFARLGGAKMV